MTIIIASGVMTVFMESCNLVFLKCAKYSLFTGFVFFRMRSSVLTHRVAKKLLVFSHIWFMRRVFSIS